jgi:hypothetical protein
MEEYGYCAVDTPRINFDACRFRRSGSTRTGRRIYTLDGATKAQLREIATPAIHVVTSRMIAPALAAIQKISALPGAAVQEVHRDHDLGRDKQITLVVSRSGRQVSTLFDAGSHLEEHVVLYRNAQRQKSEAERLSRMRSCPNDGAVIYDAYIMHAGVANTGTEESMDQVFITFVETAVERDDAEALNYSNFQRPSKRCYQLSHDEIRSLATGQVVSNRLDNMTTRTSFNSTLKGSFPG